MLHQFNTQDFAILICKIYSILYSLSFILQSYICLTIQGLEMFHIVTFYSAREDFRSEELDIILETMRLNMVMQNSADRQGLLYRWTEHSAGFF